MDFEHFTGNYDWLVAITRGGMMPACILAHIYDIRKIDNICVQSYDNNFRQGEVKIIAKDYSHLKGQKVLIVDDLVDTGKTLTAVVEYLGKFNPELLHTFVVYKKSATDFNPDFFLEQRPSKDWINFKYDALKLSEMSDFLQE